MSGSIVAVISGQVSAGKTTAAKMLRDNHDFEYARISQAIRKRWDGEGKPPRSWYQTMGMELHRTIGQRALCAETMELIPNPTAAFVIDGARWKTKPATFKAFPNRKKHLTAEEYLWKANANNPILSSISGSLAEIRMHVSDTEAKVNRIEIAGFIALILTVGLGILSSWSIYHNAISLLQGFKSDRDALEQRVTALECKENPQPNCRR